MAKKKMSKIDEEKLKNSPIVLLTVYLSFLRMGRFEQAAYYRKRLNDIGIEIHPERLEW